MRNFIAVLAVASGALFLAGCDPSELPPSSIAPICQALIDPIKYNTANPESKRYAGIVLAMDLAERNRVGQALRCPKYR